MKTFSSLRIKQCGQELSQSFFLPEEFPKLDRGDEPKEAVSAALRVPEDEIREYSLSLSGRAVENFLLLLPQGDEEEVRCILRVLAVRMSPRLFSLLWALYQYNPDSRAVLFAMGQALASEKYASQKVGLLSMVSSEEDKVSAVTRILISEGGDIGGFCAKYALILDSPFAGRVVRKFFSLCTIEMIEKNPSHFRNIVMNETGEDFLAAVKNYLSQMDRTQELEDVNILLLSRLGRPGNSPFWYEIDTRMVARFESWYFSYELGHHFKEGSKKLALLSRYTHFIKEIVPDDNGVVRINFGRFVLLDGGDRDDESFYLSHPSQGMKEDYRELWENRRKFGSARDFILESSDAPILRLSYHETGILFTGEMLDILLAVKLDMRKKNTGNADDNSAADGMTIELQ